ncbi:MAG: type pilus assembly protein PilM [Candidatus Berkelbacteria bacterium]|nr:type pilus assembly protein PilM [Candidatus Berkelbacteria bacterium]
MYESVLGLKKPIFGLDIGYSTLKVIQLKGEGPKAKLLGVAEIGIEPKALSKDGISDQKRVAESILTAMKMAKPNPITARLVSSALPESLVFTKSVDIPSMKSEEINKNIPYQASEFFPVPVNEMYMEKFS